MRNKQLAKILFEMADALELLEVQWKPNAYRKAARSIDTMSKDVGSIYSSDGIKGLKSIPGVGQGIAEKIEEFLKTGKIKEYQKLAKKIPKGVEEMMNIPGVGPKKAWKFYKELGIKNRTMLKRLLEQERSKALAVLAQNHRKRSLRALSSRKKAPSVRFLAPRSRSRAISSNSLKQCQGFRQWRSPEASVE